MERTATWHDKWLNQWFTTCHANVRRTYSIVILKLENAYSVLHFAISMYLFSTILLISALYFYLRQFHSA